MKRYPRTWPDGVRSPGVFMISPVHRAASVDHAGFDAHWRDRHAPLALRHHPGMWDYRQSVVRQVLTSGSPEFDGFARLGFETRRDFEERLFVSQEGREVIGADVDRFIDLRRSRAAMLGEYVIRTAPEAV